MFLPSLAIDVSIAHQYGLDITGISPDVFRLSQMHMLIQYEY